MTKRNKFWIYVFCFCCLLPALLLSTGRFTIQRPGGMSTMGVIIGPIVGLDGVIVDGGTSGSYTPDYSDYNLSKDTPYTNGA